MPEKSEPSKEPIAEEVKKELKPDKKKSVMGLYDINQVEDGFEVNMPGLLDKKRGWIVGTSKKRFETVLEIGSNIIHYSPPIGILRCLVL